jgi:Tfp pilus assembly protein PilN
MRPVNLIPLEDRRGEHAPLRTGPVAYILVGALVLILGAVAAMVLIDNQIAESKAEVQTLKSEDAVVAAKAERLAAYTQFQTTSEQRVETVSSLADSRFDWERVMRELALVLPSDVWLVNLTATATPEVSIGSGGAGSGGAAGGASLRPSVPGPALELTGCATGQESVAGFVTALKDIDGVTRVGIQSSELGEEQEESSGSTEVGAAAGGATDECRTHNFIAKFTLVVAFDAAPVVTSGEGEEEAVAIAPTEQAQTVSSESSASAESSEGE